MPIVFGLVVSHWFTVVMQMCNLLLSFFFLRGMSVHVSLLGEKDYVSADFWVTLNFQSLASD